MCQCDISRTRRVVLFFKGKSHHFNYDTTKSEYIGDGQKYIISIRDEAYLKGGFHFKNIDVDSYDSITEHRWQKEMFINYDDQLMWLRHNHIWLDTLFYLGFMGITYLVTVITRPVDSLFTRAASLGIKVDELPYVTSRNKAKQLYVCWFRNVDEFRCFFWPEHLYELLDTVHIGIKVGPDSDRPKIAIQPSFNIIDESDTLDCLRGIEIKFNKPADSCEYSLKMDLASYDVGDPTYCMKDSYAGHFEDSIRTAAARTGFELHELPLMPTLVSNWIGYGEIPQVL